MKTTLQITVLILSFITISCSKNNKDDLGLEIKHGTLKFEATTTSGGISNLFYEINDGSIELFKEGPIETNQSNWTVSHPVSSGNSAGIIGFPDSGEILTIKVYFNNNLIGSDSSTLIGTNASVAVVVP